MARTYKGASLLKTSRHQMRLQPGGIGGQAQMLDLAAMRGEIHRFEGIVDRFGNALKATGIIQTICVRQLRHCRTGQPVSLDHWWFRMRQEWMEAGLSPGDRVMFTAKIQFATKGWDELLEDGIQRSPGRRKCVGFGSRVNDLLVIRRRQVA